MNKKLFGVLLSICTSVFCRAQEDQSSMYQWRRTVSREIDAPQKNINATHDTSLAEMIIQAVKVGELLAYNSYDAGFSHQLTLEEVLETNVDCQLDTMYIIDPKTGKETAMAPKKFDFSKIKKFEILEEWSFNPHSGKTKIEISGVAPVRDIYGDDGVYRGRVPMFLVRYSDVRAIIVRHDLMHPERTISSEIWKDCFSKDTNINLRQQKVTRRIDMEEKEDTVHHHLGNANKDTCLSLMFYCSIHANQMAAYGDPNFTIAADLSPNTILQTMKKTFDVDEIFDPETNAPRPINVMQMAETYFCSLHSYKILEEWKFDPVQGKTEIQITGIAPCYSPYDGDPNKKREYYPVFWARYNDTRDIIARYEQYHPTNTIAGHIWNDYFFTDIKPTPLETSVKNEKK